MKTENKKEPTKQRGGLSVENALLCVEYGGGQHALKRDKSGNIHIYGDNYEWVYVEPLTAIYKLANEYIELHQKMTKDQWLKDAKLYIDSMTSSEFEDFISECTSIHEDT